MSASIEQKVKAIIMENLGNSEDEIKTTSRFIEDLGADSLDIVELVMQMEEEFEVDLFGAQAAGQHGKQEKTSSASRIARASRRRAGLSSHDSGGVHLRTRPRPAARA